MFLEKCLGFGNTGVLIQRGSNFYPQMAVVRRHTQPSPKIPDNPGTGWALRLCSVCEDPSCSLHNSGQNKHGFVGTLDVLKFSFNPVTLKFLSICVCVSEKSIRQRRADVP